MPEIVKPTPAPVRGNFPVIPITQAPNLKLDYFYDAERDANYRPGMVQQFNRADNQSWLAQLGNGVMSRGLSIGTKTLAGLGSVGTALAVPFSSATIDDIWNNPLTQWANSLDQSLSKTFPVFQSQEYAEGDLLQKMMTTSFWATDGMDGLAFAASAFIPGKLIGAGLKSLESGQVGANLFDKLSKIGINAHKTNLVAATAYNTISEAAAEAYQTQKELESIYIEQGYNGEQAKLLSAKAAREVFGANLAVLAIPNYIQNRMFHGAWAAKTSAARKAAIESQGNATAQALLESKWKDVAGGFMSEGLWEENAQTSIQQYERAVAKGFADKPMLNEVADNLYSNMKGFAKSVLPGDYDVTPDQQEGAISIALGGLLGMGFGARSAFADAQTIKDLVKNENEAYQKFATDVIPAALASFKDNRKAILKQNGVKKVKQGDTEIEVPNYELDDKGNFVVDEEAVHQLVLNGMADSTRWSIETLAAMKNNETVGTLNKEVALASYAHDLAMNSKFYSKEDVEAILQNYTKVGEAEAEQVGTKTDIRENLQTVSTYLQASIDAYNKYATTAAVKDPKEFGFRTFLAKTDLYLQAKLNALNKIKGTTTDPKTLFQIDNLIQDALEQQQALNTKKDSLRKLYDATVEKSSSFALELKKLNEKETKTEEDYNRIRELSYLLNEEVYSNGTHTFQGTGARTNPIGLNSAKLIKTSLGRRDEFVKKAGDSWIALHKAQQALNQPEPDVKTAELELSKVTVDVDSDLLADTSNKLLEMYNEAEEALASDAEKIKTLRDISSDLSGVVFEEDTPVGQMLMPETLDALQIDPTAILTQEEFDAIQQEVEQALEQVAGAEQILTRSLANVQSKKDFYQNFQERFDAVLTRDKAYQEAADKDLFLKREYFKDVIEEPTKAFIANALANKETIDDFNGAVDLLNQLKNVVAAYNNRKDNAPPDVKDRALQLITELSEVIDIITKNLNNRTLIQTITNDRAVENTLAALKSSAELVQLIKTILSTDPPTAEQLSIENVLSYDGLSVVLSQIRSKATPEQIQKILDLLQEEQDRVLTSMWDAISEDIKKSPVAGSLKNQLISGKKWYGKLPHSQIRNVITWALPKDFESPALAKMAKDLDILAFQTAIPTMPGLTAVQTEMLYALTNAHFKVNAILHLSRVLSNSKLDEAKLLELKGTLDPSPSLQQNIVLQEALEFLHSTVGTEEYDNWFVVNGIAGSGKSHIIGTLVPSIWAKLNNKNLKASVFAFSRNERTSENINKAVGLKPTTFEDFTKLTDEQLKAIDILIIDEVYTFSNRELYDIQTRIKELQKAGHVIKVLALGDLSQLTVEEEPVLQELFAGKAKVALPLTVSYRTNVDSIAVFSNQFRLKSTLPSSSFVSATRSLEDTLTDPSKTFGVLAASENDIVVALKVPSSRSRVLIVPTQSDVELYKRLLPQVPVLTPEEAQGYQWDEVYAILNPAIYPDVFTSNQAIYTAISRAKSLLMVSGLPVSNSEPRDSRNTLEQEGAVMADNERLFKNSVKKGKMLLEGGVPIVTKEQLKQEPVPTVEVDEEMPLAEEDKDIVAADEAPVVPPTDELPEIEFTDPAQVVNLMFPKNSNIKPIEINGNKVLPVVPGSKGFVIKTSRNKGEFYYLIAPHTAGGFTVIGSLGDGDFKRNPFLSEITKSKVPGIAFTKINESGRFQISEADLNNSVVKEFIVGKLSHLQTKFTSPEYNDTTLGTHAGGLDVIEQTIVNFYNSYYGIDEDGQRRYPAEVYDAQGNVRHLENDWIINGRPNWKVLKDKVEVRLMTEKERSKIAAENPDFNFVLKGTPYLVIREPKQKGAKAGKASKSIYIQLQPTKVAQDSERLGPIKQLRDAIAELESILGKEYALGTPQLSQLVSVFAKVNFTVGQDNKSIIPIQNFESSANLDLGLIPEQYSRLDTLLKTIIELTYGVEKKLVVFDTKEEAEQFLTANTTANQDGTWTLLSNEVSTDTGEKKKYTITSIAPMGKKFILKYSSSVEDADATKNFEQLAVRQGAGPAQHQLNALAMANHSIGEIPFRVTSNTTQGGRSVKLTRAKSIFATSKLAFDLELFLKDSRVENSGWTRTSFDASLAQSATQQALIHLTNTYDEETAKAIIAQYTIYPTTLETLNAIVAEDQFVDGRHISLRTPLQLTRKDLSGVNDIGTDHRRSYTLDQEGPRRSLSVNLTSTFSGMQRTEVSIGFGTSAPAKETPKVVAKISDAWSLIPASPLADLLKSIKEIQNVPYYQQDFFMDENQRIELWQNGEFLAVTHVSSQYPGGMAILSPATLSELPKEVLTHEIIHVATSRALTKGKTDTTDTKERIFYQRVTELQNIFNSYLADNGIDPTSVYGRTLSDLDEHEFIANLANAEFVKVAKKVQVDKKSLFTRILDAILDVLGAKPNVYDALLKTLEDYYSTGASKPIKIKTVKKLPIDEVSEKIIKLANSFENKEEIRTKYLTGIYDLKALANGEVKFSKIFDKKNDAEKLNKLEALLNILTGLSGNTHFAIFNTPNPKLIATKGGALMTSGLAKAISQYLPEFSNLPEAPQNFIYSLIHYQLTHAGINYLNNLFTLVDNGDYAGLASEVWNNILSSQDRLSLKESSGIKTDKEAVLYLKDNPESDLMALAINSIKYLDENKQSVENVTGSLEDRMPYIYKAAKDYVVQLIRENQNLKTSDKELMRTRYSMFVFVLNKVKSDNAAALRLSLATKKSKLEMLRTNQAFTDEYYRLLYNEIPELENTIFGMEALKTTNSRTGNLFVEDIYREIYPRDPLNKIDSMELAMEIAELEQATGDVDAEMKEVVNINEYIKEYNKSPELTLSESMKDFLFTAAIVSSSGTQKYLSSNLMFVKLLQLVATLEFGSSDELSTLSNVYTQLQERLARDLSDIDRTVLNTLATTIDAIIHPDDTIPNSVTIVTGSDSAGNIWYAAARSSRGEDISNLTYEQLKSTSQVSVTSQQVASNVLFTQLQRLYPELTISQFNKLLARAEAINTIRGIMNTIASMRETDLYIGTTSYQGGLVHKMMRSKASGITFAMKETIREALQEHYNNETFFDVIEKFQNAKINGKPAKSIPESGSPADKLEYIKLFYEKVVNLQGINIGVSIASDASGKLQDYVIQISNLIKVAQGVSKTSAPLAEELFSEETSETTEQDSTFGSFIDNIDGYLTRLSEFASLSSEYLRNPSVRTLKGDRYYKWHESSFGGDVLTAITDVKSTAVLRGATGNNIHRRIPEHLFSSFYNYNIFVRGPIKNKIYATGEWEGTLNEDNGSSTEYLRENFRFFYQRKFLLGFVDMIRQYGDSYMQYTYVPSDKPKYPLARIDVLGDKEIIPAIELVLTQILETSQWKANVENFEKAKTTDLFRNFLIAEQVIKDLGIEFNAANIPTIAKAINDRMEVIARETLGTLTSEDVEIKLPKDYAKTFDKSKNLLNTKYKDTAVPVNKSGNFDATKASGYQDRVAAIENAMIPMFELFFKNNYINGYFLNQLMTGDYAAYKSPEDIIKRYIGVLAPGVKGLVDDVVGMSQEYKVLILEDTHIEYSNTAEVLKDLLFGGKTITPKDEAELERVLKFFDESGYDMTDAQGFMTPSRATELGRGFERAWYRGSVHKPVHFEVQNVKVKDAEGNQLYDDKGRALTAPIPRYTKYSSIVLTDEMLNAVNSPKLRALRDKLDRLGIGEAIFKSGIKEGGTFLMNEEGTPLFTNEEGKHRWMYFDEFVNADDELLATLSRLDSFKNDDAFKGGSGILTLSNKHFRLQHNPASDVNKQVSIYTQLMYFLNVFSNSNLDSIGVHPSLQPEADKVYGLIGELIKMGRESFEAQVQSPAAFRKFLRNKFADSPNSERVAELLESRISFNNPLVEKKAIIALASGMESSTVKVKFSGGKLVLQSAIGVEITTGEKITRDLKYRADIINGKRVMVAEVLVPEEMLTPEMKDALDKKENLFLHGDALGFRIPSTELHSAVPLKVVGTYSPLGKSNVIIAPKELVPIHGSDFDVDALFVIMRENFTKDEIAIVTSDNIIAYQEALKKFLDTVTSLNANGQYTEYLNGIKTQLGFNKDEPIENFVDQAELESRFEDYVSTPNYDPTTKSDIIRIDDENFSKKELLYRYEWGKLHGYTLEKSSDVGNYTWKLENSLLASMYELQRSIEEAPEEIKTLLPASTMNLLTNNFLGSTLSPVGYTKQDSLYVIDESFIPKVKEELTKLKELSQNLHIDVRALVLPSVTNSIRRLERVLEKAIKNNISETMLMVISDINRNGYRMVTPINFAPLREAIKSLGDLSKDRLDLSDVRSEYKVFYSLSSGAILTGAFANAAKVFAYLTQAGDSASVFALVKQRSELLEEAKSIQADLELLDLKEEAGLTPEDISQKEQLLKSKEELTSKLSALSGAIKLSRASRKDTQTYRGQINPTLHFDIDGIVYDKLETRDKLDKYNITETLDTLINAAIDNLKLGLLGQAKINTQTGSAVVGGIFLGVPLETVIKLLNQPILNTITAGISDKKDAFLKNTLKKYANIVPSTTLTTEDLNRGLSLSTDPESWSEADLSVQLKVLQTFEKMNRIGEDARNLSSFLGVIQDVQVTVEKLDALDHLITNKIGNVDQNTFMITPHKAFAFLVPNLLTANPHILEAYKTHLSIQKLVSEHFSLHSPTIRKFAKQINANLDLESSNEIKNTTDNLAAIRRALAHYILARQPWETLSQTTKPATITIKNKDNKTTKVTLSIVRTFMQQTADELKLIQNFAKDQNIKNMFLDNVFIGTDRLGVPIIQFKGGVNLHAEDHMQIALDFRNLNRFVIKDKTVSYNPNVTPYTKSEFQGKLVNYAVLAYGLSYGSSNFSIYIPASFIKEIDTRFSVDLKQMIQQLDSKSLPEGITPHFRLSYVAQNASRLGFISFSDLVVEDKQKNGSAEDLIEVGPNKFVNQTIYYDLKAKNPGKGRNPNWVKEGWGTRTVVYKKVASSTDYDYYQKVGRIKDLYYTPLQDPNNYSLEDYFDPNVYTLPILYRENNVVYSSVKIEHFMDSNTPLYIVPFYNFDRSDRTLVKIVSAESVLSGKYPGYKYKIEEVDSMEITPKESKVATYSGLITELKEDEIFVFGSNPLGINGNPSKGTGGAALAAYNIAGVKQGERMDNKLSDSGKAWGITTVSAPGARRSKTPSEIKEGIRILYEYAKQNPSKRFLIAYQGLTGTNLNGYTNKELANMFSSFSIPSNVVFEKRFASLLNIDEISEIDQVLKEKDKGCKS